MTRRILQFHRARSGAGARLGLVPLIALTLSCAPTTARRENLRASHPIERAEAIVATAEARDREAIHVLVERLEDEDRAVRMYAILALRDLCGEDFGYRYYASDADRAAAVSAWRQALREGRIRVPAGAHRVVDTSPPPSAEPKADDDRSAEN